MRGLRVNKAAEKSFPAFLFCALVLLSCQNIFNPDGNEAEICAAHDKPNEKAHSRKRIR